MSTPSHWSERYVGQAYVPGENDCAELAARVQREVFGREIRLPSERACGLRGLSAQIGSARDDYGAPTDAPEDGDAVLMTGRGRLSHIGVYCLLDGAPWVLHAMKRAGQVVRHRLRELPAQGLTVEGFYKWT